MAQGRRVGSKEDDHPESQMVILDEIHCTYKTCCVKGIYEGAGGLDRPAPSTQLKRIPLLFHLPSRVENPSCMYVEEVRVRGTTAYWFYLPSLWYKTGPRPPRP